MSASDGLGVLIGFSVVTGLILGVLKSRKTKPKTSDSKPIVSDNSETTKDPEHDVTYGEDTFEQEDNEYHEEVW